jgi:starch synthase
LDNIDHFVQQGAKFVILGSGEAELEHRLREYAYKYPKAVKFFQGYNNSLAHQIYASSDFFLMPSLFEPCGIAQMIAMRYGTLPIVRETGGLIDTVKGYSRYKEEATGFSFQHYTGDSLGWAMNQAIEIYSIKDKLYQPQQNAYHQQNDWKKASELYLKIYSYL